MPVEGNKRPPRTPRAPEEIEQLILLKKIREHKKLERFKKTIVYKSFNVFNVICFFIYCELIMCFAGPCHYQIHYSKSITPEHGMAKNMYGDRILLGLKVTGINGKQYRFPINDFVEVPEVHSAFNVGKDFILQKEIKGTITTSDKIYRIHAADPIFFLSIFVAIFSCIFFNYNLNEHPYPLGALTAINAITVIAFMLL